MAVFISMENTVEGLHIGKPSNMPTFVWGDDHCEIEHRTFLYVFDTPVLHSEPLYRGFARQPLPT
jgi:hypothetical protein